ncbi:molybdopterin-dependent oxidoreductase [Pseudochryseolinea flava]|uniref:Molybdopterin-binding protein n=1 Tax=Pseudochryseolinea flava TaxID=2059302 RepID=A0A364Y208_9BACT|nr:molybdopterin-dependent oxidoreductase [Pseudochryseolinea flava]RAV99999.1 molybdopterin-binding protein [Pseudochryseolinea flava]
MIKIQATIFILLFFRSVVLAQSSESVLSIEGEVLQAQKVTLTQLNLFPQHEVVVKDRDGRMRKFKGVLLATLLDSVDVTLGNQLRGENLTKYVAIKAADGYEVVYSLAEIDPSFSAHEVLVATQVDDHSLPKGEGPFRIIAPQDKKPARWIREVTTIRVLFAQP